MQRGHLKSNKQKKAAADLKLKINKERRRWWPVAVWFFSLAGAFFA